MTTRVIWDPLVRLFHWSLVAGFAANALILDEESTAHEFVGYAVVGLVLFRILWGLFGTRHARFADFPPSPAAVAGQVMEIATGRATAHAGHSPLGALMIYNLLAVMLLIGMTGYMMTTNAYWGVAWVQEAHEVLVTWAEISIVVHVTAVVWESRRTGVNLARSMITGKKTFPGPVHEKA